MQLSPRRLFFGTSTALVLAAIAASMMAARVSSTVTARKQASQGAERLASSFDRDPDARALALSYLERARLGLGSPYRLMDEALHDGRLPDSVRQNVAWAIVDRVFDGRIYEIDPRVLDVIASEGEGAAHLRIIDEVVGSADDPRVAEAGLRIAFGLAASNGTTSLTSLPVVAEVVAQARDRVLAMRDVHEAVARARDHGVGLIDELVHSRSTRELEVERPILGTLAGRNRQVAIDMAPGILERIESVRPEPVAPLTPSLLDKDAATLLARLAATRPPLAAVRVPVTGRAATLRADMNMARSALPVVAAAGNEESLVAAFAYGDAASHMQSASLRRLMVSTGVALRAHSQDPVWFGAEQMTAGAVIGRYALKTIRFDRDIPTALRPFYVQMIAGSLDDFSRAIPGYDPSGLTFSVEMGPLPDSALAMHDPRTRTIRLSVMTPSGTLAHELAHDVDWRAARRLFAKSGGYATDRSQRESAIRLASSVRGLTSARIAGRGRISSHGSSRPAEVFARSVDWFVADALAASGRSNGYLTAIEDPLLTGFATAPGDAPSGEAARALVGTLAEMTYVPDSAASAYVARWSAPEALDPASIVLRTMDAPILLRRRVPPVFGLTRDMITDLTTGILCQVQHLRDGSPDQRLIAMAIDARAKGVVMRRARYAPSYARADVEPRLITAGVVDGFARAGLIELAPAPFQPRCS